LKTSDFLIEADKKLLYSYQQEDVDAIFKQFEHATDNYRLLYQLPTGGGKTVIFSEIARRFIQETGKKVLVLTHRIELCKQTSKMLKQFEVKNKVIDSDVKTLEEESEFECFVAMIETLNNRLQGEEFNITNLGLIIVDEAHFNSFRKLFSAFTHCKFLGVTATPLSSNIKLPMYQIYNELIVGKSIKSLIENKYLAVPETYCYDVGLSSLKIGINGDYTVKSSDELYTSDAMQHHLITAYENHCIDKKTLIFNNGIRTSKYVYEVFREKKYPIRHLDNTASSEERKEILKWFKHTPNAILTSVGILTTGFDEPTVQCVILNRATRSLTLYFQMIGRASRKLPNKDQFTIVDLGNNVARFGAWTDFVDWHYIFKYPEQFIHHIKSDVEIEEHFQYKMPEEVKLKFKNTKDLHFDIEKAYRVAIQKNQKPRVVIDASMEQHAAMCVDNATDLKEAKILARLLTDDIFYRVKLYTICLGNATKNYREWLIEEYITKLPVLIGKLYRQRIMDESDE